jgi:ribonuclease BN (tRNA processing enzyme)
MRVTVVGCAGSFAGPESAASCYLVQADDLNGRTWNLLLDLGNGALGPLQLWCDPMDLDAVGLSHLHPDHVADISSLYVYLRYSPGPARERPLPVYGPFGTASRLGESYGVEPGESSIGQVAVHVWQPGHAVAVGPMRVLPVAVEHSVPSYGVRVAGPSESDPLRIVTLGYTGDTDDCPGLEDVAAGVDVLIAEASFLEGRDVVRGVHLTGRRAGEAAERGGVGRLLLTHVPAWNDPEDAAAEARAVFGGAVLLAHPGVLVEL